MVSLHDTATNYPKPAHKGETPNNTLIWKKFGAGLSIVKLLPEFKSVAWLRSVTRADCPTQAILYHQAKVQG